jgi:hypothetical protein
MFVAVTEMPSAVKVTTPVTPTLVPTVRPAHVADPEYVVAAVTPTGTPRTVIVGVGHTPVTAVMTSVPSTTSPSADAAHPRAPAHSATRSPALLGRAISVDAVGAAPSRFDGAFGDRRALSEHALVSAAHSSAATNENRIFVIINTLFVIDFSRSSSNTVVP